MTELGSSSTTRTTVTASRISRTDRPRMSDLHHNFQSMDLAGSSPPTHPTSRMSVTSLSSLGAGQRRPSTSALDEHYPPLRRRRPARVFWDLELCSIGGRDYFQEIIKTIQTRVEADTGQDVFEIYASFNHATHIPNDVYQELLAYDVNFNLILDDKGEPGSVADDLYEQVEKFCTSQSQRTHLFPYALLIAGNVDLIDKMEKLEKNAKIVYAVRKEKDSNFNIRLGNHIVYEYTMTKGIQARIN